MKRTDMDNHSRYSRKWKNSLTAGVLLALALGGTGYAMPTGGQIQSGQGAIAQNGKTMTVTQQSGKMAVDWTQFNIAKDEAVKFAQPGRDAVALNRITGGQKSVIDGALSANGNVLLVNPNGVVFSKTATVDVGSLVASTAQLNDPFMKSFAGSTANLNLTIGERNTSAILNEGTITAQGGLVALHAAQVENTGTISNPGGTVALAAAKQLTLSPDSDGKLNYAVDGELAQAKALNSGRIQADGGYVVMTAKSAQDLLGTVVNNTGTLEARTLRKDEKGQILLDGGKSGQVEVSGTLDASGMEDGQSAGSIKVIGQKTIVHDNTNLIAQGNVDGGKIETSGDVLNLGDGLTIDASGVKGKHGEWLLDPLEVVISASKPSSADHKYDNVAGDTNGKTKNNVIYNDPPSKQNANNAYNSTTWIDSNQVGTILAGGTDVIIQAISTSGAASITLESPIDITVSNSAKKNPTFTLEANRNITINKEITAESGGKGLNIMLNADTDGDGIGAVIINADIATNGGNFTAVTGGKVSHTSKGTGTEGQYGQVNVGGAPAHEHLDDPNYNPATVGTYFGGTNTSIQAENRSITTNGGAITLNGEVAIGLNGGTLTLDTSGGDLTVTGLINSGNSYKAYIYGTDDWNNNEMIQNMVEQYLKGGTVPAYHYIGITYDKDKDGNLIKDGNGYKWSTKKGTYAEGANNIHYVLNALTDTTTVSGKSGTELSAINPQWYTSTKAGEGYDSFIVDKASTITVDEYLAYVKKSAPENWKTKYNALTLDAIRNDTTKMATLKADIAELIAHNWFLAEQIAENGTSGGAEVRDSYLATITTRLENSLSTPNGQHTLWVGGRGSGVRGRTVNDDKNNPATWGPSDPTLMDGFYWVTGPEGAASTYKDSEGNTLKYDAGTKFWDTVSSDWKTGKNGEKVYGLDPTWSTYKPGRKTITQPDNNGPFLTVGYGSDNQWDDANFGGETTWGFVQESNLANSSLKINTGKGAVNLKGDIGKGQALDTLNIENAGTVKIGDASNKVTDYNNGTVYVDHGLKISSTGNVTVGGEIHSGESEKTDTSTSLDDQYKDSVTIQSVGNLEVHGITSNTYTPEGTTNVRGGKISLTSTGTEGVITLGDGVDYNGKNTNGGVLKASSTTQGAVIIDAQGSKGGFVNKTTAENAIVTGETTDANGKKVTGTWQVYSASPDKDTFGTNLNSGTDAQWTSKSASNTIATKNKYGKTPNSYSDTSSNKFIFQATPVITLYADDYLKTYGDEVSAYTLKKLLHGKEVFTGLDGQKHNMTDYSSAFQEKDYTEYVSGEDTVTVTSVGSNATATRIGGKYEATEKSGADGKNAVYDLTVNLNDAKALDGYAIDTENGKLEIKKRSVTITSSSEQTYGDKTYTSWNDKKNGFANGDEKNFTYEHGIKSGSAYETNLNKTTGRTTADAGEYQNSVYYSNPTISGKKNADGTDDSDFFNENYTFDTTNSIGSIKVNKADLTLTLKDVSTTYGKEFDGKTYGYKKDAADLQGLTNGDAATAITDVLKDSDFTYVNGGAKSDPDNQAVKTQNAGSYQITGSTSKTLDNYNIKVVKPGTSKVEKATLVVDTKGNTRTYGDVTNVADDVANAASFHEAGGTNQTVNGDTVDSILKELNLSTDSKAQIKDEKGNVVKTGNANLDGYDIDATFKTELTNYTVTKGNVGKEKIEKAALVVDTKGDTRTYGDVTNVAKDVKNAASFHVAGGTDQTVNGDAVDSILRELNLTTSSGALVTDTTGKIKTGDANTDPGYDIKAAFNKDLTNYTVTKGVVGKEKIQKATLHLSTGDYEAAYGAADKVTTDLQSATTIKGETNGDKLTDLVPQIGIKNTSGALLKEETTPGTGRTADVKYKADGKTPDSYEITTEFNKSLDNYDVVLDKPGTVTLTPVAITVDNEMIQTYGSADRSFKEIATPPLVNGDTISTAGLTMAPKAGGAYETNRAGRTTADVGTYEDDLAFSGGGIVHADGTTDASKNYKVTIKGGIIVNRADLTVTTKDVTTPFGTVKFTTSGVQGLTNGDEKNVSDLKFNYGSYGNAYLDNNSYTNAPGQYEFTTETTNQYLDFLKNYNILGGDAAVTITPVDKPVKPDITPEKPNPVPEGKGEVEEPSMDDFRGEEEHRDGGRTWYREKKSIPFFKVLDGKVTNYGTFDVESMPEKVEITSSGMRLPEPDQPETQHREYTTTLTLPGGDGTYRLVYNGVSFDIHPVDTAALRLLEAGDPKKNKELSEAALHTGFQKMGLGLEDLKAVYVRFN
ncbi:filamentous hemagglutinin N-terminal domain-containing protein [Acidaminococcus fermentans]|uniref:two-partner secretion domain-containing protein n=1 Tax=Acidaminococcus fermentans TaxID=905 RepID=UPI002E798951|nr:filamentous hemagglutinin N-terminal domain-containing protein [Acidaminococcus fermentans]MEE0338946.1 filamentous hemagglutinin N-terminal domain-containing protein [Acidaminococcus fermentans]